MMKLLFLISTILMLSCDVENKFENTLNSYVGKDYNSIIDYWGHPTEIQTVPNKNDILHYLRIKDETSPFPDYLDEDGHEIPSYCNVYFEVGKDLKIIKYSYSGNYCWED